MRTKKCVTCRKPKPIKCFGKKSAAKDGKQSRCNPCLRRRANELIAAEWKNPTADRFWPKVDKRGPDECWPWKAAKRVIHPNQPSPLVYGSYNAGNAHRMAWIIANGRQPKPGNVICHRCDFPLCCNPSHLFEGTIADNQQDMMRKNRSILGERNPRCKTTEETVRAIKAETGSHTLVGKKYGLSPSHISRIRSGAKWRHVM